MNDLPIDEEEILKEFEEQFKNSITYTNDAK